MASKRIPTTVRQVVAAVCRELETVPSDTHLEWTWGRYKGEDRKLAQYYIHVYPLDVEIVGGPQDGLRSPASFAGDLTPIMQLFGRLDSLHVSTVQTETVVDGRTVVDLPCVSLRGTIRNTRVCLHLSFIPPPLLPPGLLLDVNSGRRRIAS